MSEFWFIRHGQSETNIGLTSPSDASTPLTEKGKRQAEYVARYLNSPPDLFVVSPYLRTHQTASPTLKKFPNVPVETWDIQEYSYLGEELFSGTTTRDRRNLSKNFFWEADPDKTIGPGGESFNQFLDRVDRCFTQLFLTDADRVILFGHGWFIRAGLWILINGNVSRAAQPNMIDEIKTTMPTSWLPLSLFNFFQKRNNLKEMHTFMLLSGAVRTPNCFVLKFNLDKSERTISLIEYVVDHLPDQLR